MPAPYTSFTGPINQGATCWGEKFASPTPAHALLTFAAPWPSNVNVQLVRQAGGSIGLTFTPLWGSFTMDNGWVNLAYDEEWALEYAATPITFSLVSGSIPTGLSLSSFGTASGRISGTPTVAGTYSFTLRATNAFGFADKAFSIIISVPTGGGGKFTFLM